MLDARISSPSYHMVKLELLLYSLLLLTDVMIANHCVVLMHAVLCCAALCCVVLCCAVLCAVLCCIPQQSCFMAMLCLKYPQPRKLPLAQTLVLTPFL